MGSIVLTYENFDLAISPDEGGGYTARVIQSPAGEASQRFTLPFEPHELENYVLKIGHTSKGVRRIETEVEQTAREFGSRIFDAVFDDDVGASLAASLQTVEAKSHGLRIRLRLGEAPELAAAEPLVRTPACRWALPLLFTITISAIWSAPTP